MDADQWKHFAHTISVSTKALKTLRDDEAESAASLDLITPKSLFDFYTLYNFITLLLTS